MPQKTKFNMFSCIFHKHGQKIDFAPKHVHQSNETTLKSTIACAYNFTVCRKIIPAKFCS